MYLAVDAFKKKKKAKQKNPEKPQKTKKNNLQISKLTVEKSGFVFSL